MSLNFGETLQPFKPLNQLIYDSAGNLIGIQNDRANGSDLRIGGGSGVDGTFATLVATTALKLNSGATFDLYNTADQTTNYERLRVEWNGNIARLFVQSAGSGTERDFRVGTSTLYHIYQQRTNATPLITASLVSTTATTANGIHQLYSGTLSASSGTQTPVSIAPTFNQSSTAGYTVVDINPTETATGSGTKLLQRWAVGGTAKAQVDSGGLFYGSTFAATTALAFSTSIGGTGDVTLVRDASDTLAIRRGTNAQTFRVYETYTDASNFSRWSVSFTATQCQMGTSAAGTGTKRKLEIYGSSISFHSLSGATTEVWNFSTSGHFLAFADNTYDIGASGANRPRNVYIGGSTIIGAFHTVGVSTVATLPAAAGAARAQIFVSDSSVAAAGNFGAIVAGGGANIVPVFSDGTNWRIG